VPQDRSRHGQRLGTTVIKKNTKKIASRSKARYNCPKCLPYVVSMLGTSRFRITPVGTTVSTVWWCWLFIFFQIFFQKHVFSLDSYVFFRDI
jgi:hypothetical protein